MQKPLTPKKKWMFRLAGLILSFVILFVGECLLRLIKPDLGNYAHTFRMNTHKTNARRFSAIKEPDPDLLWRLKPASSLSETEYLNTRGFRTQEFELEKNPGVNRIVILGDSRSFGFGVEDKKIVYAERMQSFFTTSGKTDIQILNLSVIGYSSYQGLKLLENFVSELQPNQLIVWFGFNDLLFYHITDKTAANKHFSGHTIDQILNRSFLYHWLQISVKTLLTPVNRGIDLEQTITPRVPLDDFRNNIEQIIAKAHYIGASVVLMTSPVRKEVPMVLNSQIRLITGKDGLKYRKLITQYEIDKFWLMDSTEFPGSEDELDTLLKKNSDIAILQYFKGVFLRDRGEIELAGKRFQRAQELDMTRERIKAYNQVIASIAEEHNTGFIDLAERFNEFSDYPLFIDDCHPNSNGHGLIAATLLEFMTGISSKVWTP
ncbi:hypothetical protein K8T06_02920 [bacterium]|nr:hypothetical protein [bacterium]